MNFWNEHQPYFKTRVLPTPDQSLIIFLGVRTAPGLGKKVTLPKFGGGERNPSGNYIHPFPEIKKGTFSSVRKGPCSPTYSSIPENSYIGVLWVNYRHLYLTIIQADNTFMFKFLKMQQKELTPTALDLLSSQSSNNNTVQSSIHITHN